MYLRIARSLPMIVVMGIIFFLSHQPGDALQLPQISNLDKVLHAGVYAVLGWSCCLASPPSSWRYHPRATAAAVWGLCLLYGMSDEVHQFFIAGRQASAADMVADGVGALIAVGLYWRYLRVGEKSYATQP